MKRIYLILYVLVVSTAFSYAKYEPQRLYEMAIKADKIVYGEIVGVDSLTFCLDIEGSITGDDGLLTVYKFRNWTCAHRWTDYEVGQRVFLFLKYYKGKLRIMSGGGEGELPISENNVYISQRSIPSYGNIPPPPPWLKRSINFKIDEDKAFPVTCFRLYDGNFYGYSMELKQFIRDVTDIRTCFYFEYKPWWRISNVKTYWSDELVNSKKKNSKLFRLTYEALYKTDFKLPELPKR